MEILKAQLGDLPIILELQKLCYTENAQRYNDYQIAPMTQTLHEIEKENTENIVLKAVELAKIVGSIRAYEKEGTCYIGRVIVHPDYQNKGIGKKLMDEIEERFDKVSRFELFTGFRDEKNLYFYNKLGYKIFKQIKLKEDLTLVYLEKINLKKN
jgi:ribosomal protein S18 acetylase RimI-like enzyme